MIDQYYLIFDFPSIGTLQLQNIIYLYQTRSYKKYHVSFVYKTYTRVEQGGSSYSSLQSTLEPANFIRKLYRSDTDTCKGNNKIKTGRARCEKKSAGSSVHREIKFDAIVTPSRDTAPLPRTFLEYARLKFNNAENIQLCTDV